jgi:pimeloyl-ACP methyl ester carboxylesterase
LRTGALALTAALALAPADPSTVARAAEAFSVRVVGSGPPVLFIPGLNSSGVVWDGVVERYRQRYTCHVLTLAGFAGQAPIGPPFLPTVRDAILQYVVAQRLDRPAIVGHSLGGFLAFWLGATAPDRVGRIVAVDGVPFLPALSNPSASAETLKPQAEAMRDALLKASPEERARQSTLSIASMITSPEHVGIAERWARDSDPATTAQAMIEMMTTDLREEVARIKTPVLLIAAGAAFASSKEALDQVAKVYEGQVAKIPDHRTLVAERAKHFIMLDDPEFLIRALDEFLK